MKVSRSQQEVMTALSVQGGWLKLLQVRHPAKAPEGAAELLGMKARRISGFREEQVADALKELVRALPMPPSEVVCLFPAAQLLSRYFLLPSEKPEELQAMALYQMEGLLPYPIQECVVSVKVLGRTGEATRVLAAAAHRPDIERLIRICRQAGLNLNRMIASSEAVGSWHLACLPPADRLAGAVPPSDVGGGRSAAAPSVWLVAEATREDLDMGVLVNGSLVYMRQIPRAAGGWEELAEQLHDTLRAYEREQVGPPVKEVTVSGSPEGLEPGWVERLESVLELPIRRIDPLERSPFQERLAVTAQQLAPEVSFSELLGAACAPRLLGLDLLPVEVRQQQQRQRLMGQLRQTLLWAGLLAAVAVGWAAARLVGTGLQLREVRSQIRECQPRVAGIRAMVAEIETVSDARADFARQMEWLNSAIRHLSPDMKVQLLALEANRALTIRATAPDFSQMTRYSSELRREPVWKEVLLRSAKSAKSRAPAEAASEVEFELLLRPKE